MRVISGTLRGTKLETLEGENTRPTLDRIKESLFSIIQNRILDSYVLDLFSGSGALAIESLSRGAKYAVCCDNNVQAVRIINNNLNKTRLTESSLVLNKDYSKCLIELKNKNIDFDLIFLDPPYKTSLASNAVKQIIDYNLLAENGIIILETDEEERVVKELQSLETNIYDIRKYGRVKLMFLNRKG